MPNQQLIDYIKQAQATGQSKEEIRSALLGAGWQENDVDDGLLVMFPESTQKIVASGKFKVLIAVALLLVVGGFAYWYFVYEPKQSEMAQIERTIPSPQEQNTYDDPIALFWQKFSSGDYRVNISGGGNPEQFFYFEKGELIRVGDPKNEPGKAYFIIKKENMYSVKSFEKTFKEFDLNINQGKVMVENLRYMSLLYPLIKDVRANNFTWSKDSDGYIAKQKWNIDDGNGNTVPVDIKIIQDPATDLITTLLVRIESGKNWEETSFRYETINNIQELWVLPSDFRKEN